MRRKKPHCPILQVGKREEATPEGLGVAASNQNKSHRCNACNQEEVHANFKRCSTCKLVYYCSKSCQKRHWSEHQILCNAIKEQLNQNNETLRGLGDSSDTEMFASHLSPKKHAAIAKLVGRKCSVRSLVNDVDMEALGTLEPRSPFSRNRHCLTIFLI